MKMRWMDERFYHILIIILLAVVMYFLYEMKRENKVDDILALDLKANELKTNVVIEDFHLRKNDKSTTLLLSFVYDVNIPYQNIIDIFEIEEYIRNYKMSEKMYMETDKEGKLENVLRDILQKLKMKYQTNKYLKEISGIVKVKIHDENTKRYHGKTLDNDIYYTAVSLSVN